MWFAKEAKWQILHHTSNFYLIWHLSTYYFLVVKSLINESHFDQCQRGKPELLWWWSRYGTVINWRLLGLKDLLIFLITILSTKWCLYRKKNVETDRHKTSLVLISALSKGPERSHKGSQFAKILWFSIYEMISSMFPNAFFNTDSSGVGYIQCYPGCLKYFGNTTL